MGELRSAVWTWLPARADRSRVTDPAAIAAALRVPAVEVHRVLLEMEAAGHAARDRRVGRRAWSWHRGLPLDSPGEQEGLWS